MPDPVPDAIAALVAAVHADHPGAGPERLGRLVVAALRRDGWRVCAPTGRATTAAAPTTNAQTVAQEHPGVWLQGAPERPFTENEYIEMRHL